jgi:hypothetical protein
MRYDKPDMPDLPVYPMKQNRNPDTASIRRTRVSLFLFFVQQVPLVYTSGILYPSKSAWYSYTPDNSNSRGTFQNALL